MIVCFSGLILFFALAYSGSWAIIMGYVGSLLVLRTNLSDSDKYLLAHIYMASKTLAVFTTLLIVINLVFSIVDDTVTSAIFFLLNLWFVVLMIYIFAAAVSSNVNKVIFFKDVVVKFLTTKGAKLPEELKVSGEAA